MFPYDCSTSAYLLNAQRHRVLLNKLPPAQGVPTRPPNTGKHKPYFVAVNLGDIPVSRQCIVVCFVPFVLLRTLRAENASLPRPMGFHRENILAEKTAAWRVGA